MGNSTTAQAIRPLVMRSFIPRQLVEARSFWVMEKSRILTLVVMVFSGMGELAGPEAEAESPAAPIVVQTKIEGSLESGGNEILNAPKVIAKSGQLATIEMWDRIKYEITTTLRPHGIVDVQIRLLSEHKKDARSEVISCTSQLGEERSVIIGKLLFTTTVSLKKDIP